MLPTWAFRHPGLLGSLLQLRGVSMGMDPLCVSMPQAAAAHPLPFLACTSCDSAQWAERRALSTSASTSYASSSQAQATATLNPHRLLHPSFAAASAKQRKSPAQNGGHSSKPVRSSSMLVMPEPEPSYFVGLHNLRDNPGARQQV